MQRNRAIVRLSDIRENAEKFAALAGGAKLCAVVKADAYGHGAETVAPALEGVADCFAVALVGEGVALRLAGVRKDVLVLVPPLCEEEVLRGISYGLIFTVGDAQDYALIASVCKKYGLCARCHIKANTGMNRFGFDFPAFRAFAAGRLCGNVSAEGIYSHFYRPEHAETAARQFSLFGEFCREGERAFGKLIRHIAATGGTIASPDYRLDMVRIGIGLYGYLPGGFAGALPLKRALTVCSTVAAVRECTGGGAGYGEFGPVYGRLAAVRAGYADGFSRAGGVGNVNVLCMDAFLSRIPAEKYAEVCVFSDADAYAERNGTISYEALTRVCGRAERVYEG